MESNSPTRSPNYTIPVPPPEFICPISLEIMRDPVTLCTGVTYDRSSIEKWFERENDTCPAMMQSLCGNHSLIPNRALRSLIQDWCEKNLDSGGYFRSCSPIDQQQIRCLLDQIRRQPSNRFALRKLRMKAKESARNSKCIMECEAVPVLVSVLKDPPEELSALEEAVSILALLPLGSSHKRMFKVPNVLSSISRVLKGNSPQGKMSAIALLDALASDVGAQIMIGSTDGIIDSLVRILRRNENQMLVNSSLRVLLRICEPSRNRIKASQMGAVDALVELLPDTEGGVAEHILIVLDLLCGCSQGRVALLNHALAIPAIVKKILRVTDIGVEHAVRILWMVSKENGGREKMRELGLSSKLRALLVRERLRLCTRKEVCEILATVYNTRIDHPSPSNIDEPPLCLVGGS